MKNNIIYFEATKADDHLKIGIYQPGDVIWKYEDVTVPMERVGNRCREMMEVLNCASRTGDSPRAYEQLKAMGRMLADELLTANIKEKLGKTDAEYLVFKLDDHVVHIPWELLCIRQDFLCHLFNTGRVVKTRQEVIQSGERSFARPLRMWIVANPRGDLPTADTEGLRIFQDMARMNQQDEIITPSLDTEVEADEVKENIKAYDFVHFAGHVDYNAQETAISGWRLSQGNFTVADIDKMAGGSPMPALVFSNACQSARTEEWKWKEGSDDISFSLANAFLRSGVRHYVGTSWDVADEPSSFFAYEFYELLRSGKTTGEAVRQARCNLTEKYGTDICWASYLLYGDPTVRYFRQGNPEIPPPKQKKIRPVSPQTPMTRGTFFNYSLNGTRLKELHAWLVLLVLVGMTAMGSVFANKWFIAEKNRVDDSRQIKIQEMLIARAEKQQERTRQLFDELAVMIGTLPAIEKEPSAEPLTMATVFDSHSLRSGKEKIILHVIADQIVQTQTAFKLLEQDSFDVVLDELVRKIRLTPPDERVRPDLLTPRLILIIELYDSGDKTLVLMRLVEKDTRQVLETLFETVDNSKGILEQKRNLTQSLLEKLEKYGKSVPG